MENVKYNDAFGYTYTILGWVGDRLQIRQPDGFRVFSIPPVWSVQLLVHLGIKADDISDVEEDVLAVYID